METSSRRLVALTVYMSPDLAEVARVLTVLARYRVAIQRFDANLSPVDTRHVSGLESLSHPVMQLGIVGMVVSDHEVERMTKTLNRLISVFKVKW